jgi:hypothetical protein
MLQWWDVMMRLRSWSAKVTGTVMVLGVDGVVGVATADVGVAGPSGPLPMTGDGVFVLLVPVGVEVAEELCRTLVAFKNETSARAAKPVAVWAQCEARHSLSRRCDSTNAAGSSLRPSTHVSPETASRSWSGVYRSVRYVFVSAQLP